MADAQLSVELQARVDQFVANLLAAANASSQTGTATTQMSSTISRNVANINRQNIGQFTQSLAAGTLSINRFNQTAASTASATRPLIVGANQAGNALTNLGRVAQDAPFGFIGIQNNLNPLLESFQRLRAETGSNSAAFRALGQSLLGPAGIGIALSVISSAVLFYQQYQQRANKATQEAKKVTDEYVKSLDAVTGASLKGAQNAAKELTTLNLLYQAYTNSNLPLKARKEAYKELQEQYPSYFTNIKFEESASIKTANAYKLLKEEILATGRARAATDKITQNETRKLENEQKGIDLERERIKLLKEQDRLQRTVDAGIGAAERGDSSGAQEALDLLKVNKQVAENQKLINNLKTDNNKIDEQNGRLVTYVNTNLAKGAKLVGGFGDEVKKVKEELQKTNTNTLGGLLGIGSLDGGASEFTIKPRLKIEPIIVGFNELQAEADKFNKQFAEIIENGISNTLSGLGESIGEALATGGNIINAIGGELLKGFGNFLSQFGDLLIEYGTAAVLKGQLDLAIATPGAGIIAGLAAIAAGVALKVVSGAIGSFASGKQSKGGGVTAFANGGIISGPTLGLMGEYAGAKSDPEVVAPLSKLKKMLGQQDAAGNAIMPYGLSQPVVLTQSLELKGTSIVAMIKKVEAQNERKN